MNMGEKTAVFFDKKVGFFDIKSVKKITDGSVIRLTQNAMNHMVAKMVNQ